MQSTEEPAGNAFQDGDAGKRRYDYDTDNLKKSGSQNKEMDGRQSEEAIKDKVHVDTEKPETSKGQS